MNHLTVILIVCCYFALLLGVAWLAGRHGNSASFFNGGRQMPWGLVAFAMIGSALSGVTFISVPGMVAAKGYSYLQMGLGFVAGYVIIAFVLIPLFYKLNLLSIYGYLEQRFGRPVYKTGAFFFILSKLLGAGVRFFVVCAVLQLLVFGPLGIPFGVNVVVTIALIWLYTEGGGVRTLVFTDLLKSFCLIASVVLAIWYVARALGLDASSMLHEITHHSSSRIFYFDDPMSPSYFWKQFVAGIFMTIAMTGLDQDMMQRHLSCTDSRSSCKNMIVSGVMQLFVIGLFLMLGTALLLYAEHTSMTMPEKSDELFGMVATAPGMPQVLGVVFVVGLVAAAYSAAGSALTSLTTAVTVDLLEAHRRSDGEAALRRTRRMVHVGVSAAMALVIIAFWELGSDDAISAVYTLASYTYGPLLGLFAFGLFSRRQPSPMLASVVCVAAPLATWVVQWALGRYTGYTVGFELLLINAALTMIGLQAASAAYSASPLTQQLTDGERPA